MEVIKQSINKKYNYFKFLVLLPNGYLDGFEITSNYRNITHPIFKIKWIRILLSLWFRVSVCTDLLASVNRKRQNVCANRHPAVDHLIAGENSVLPRKYSTRFGLCGIKIQEFTTKLLYA